MLSMFARSIIQPNGSAPVAAPRRVLSVARPQARTTISSQTRPVVASMQQFNSPVFAVRPVVSGRLISYAAEDAFKWMAFDQDTSFTQQPVIGRATLRIEPPRVPLNIVDHAALERVSELKASGRSKGHKVKRKLPDGSESYYYFKIPFDRIGFVTELVAGALARLLLGKKVPSVYAVEKAHDGDQSEYMFISEIVSDGLHDNLETWARLYGQDQEMKKASPKYMGLSIAFKLLLGDADPKLANFIVPYDGEEHCYSIDHEFTFKMPPVFVRDPAEAIRRLKDFNPKEKNNRDIPLQAQPEIISKIEPVLSAAVKRNIDDGSIIAFYERFARLTPQDIQMTFEQFGSLVSEEERAVFQSAIELRQQAVKDFLVKFQKEEELVDDLRSRLRATR